MTDPIEIIRGNLNALEEELISLQERRLAHLEERFSAVMEETGDGSGMDWDEYLDIVRGVYWEYFPQQSFGHERCLPENRRAVREMLEQNGLLDSIMFSRALARRFREEFSPVQILTARPGRQPNRVAYLRSAFSDLAYRRFSEVLDDPTVSYCDDFNAVCEDVYDGRSSLCILPLENSNEGRLTSFHNLINKYDLKLVMTCTVMSGENGALTRFGLLKRHMERIPLRRNVPHRELFEIFYTLPDEGMSIEGKLADLSDILRAARSMRLELQKIDSEPMTTADAEYGYYLTFYTDAANAELSAFLFYLMMDAPQFAPIGMYTHLL